LPREVLPPRPADDEIDLATAASDETGYGRGTAQKGGLSQRLKEAKVAREDASQQRQGEELAATN